MKDANGLIKKYNHFCGPMLSMVSHLWLRTNRMSFSSYCSAILARVCMQNLFMKKEYLLLLSVTVAKEERTECPALLHFYMPKSFWLHRGGITEIGTPCLHHRILIYWQRKTSFLDLNLFMVLTLDSNSECACEEWNCYFDMFTVFRYLFSSSAVENMK